MNTGKEAVASANGLLTTLTAGTQEGQAEYALEGSVFVAGAAIQWLRDELRILENAAQSEACCRAVEDTGGVYVVPAFTGLAPPTGILTPGALSWALPEAWEGIT